MAVVCPVCGCPDVTVEYKYNFRQPIPLATFTCRKPTCLNVWTGPVPTS
jgi:hypothetical protein